MPMIILVLWCDCEVVFFCSCLVFVCRVLLFISWHGVAFILRLFKCVSKFSLLQFDLLFLISVFTMLVFVILLSVCEILLVRYLLC